MARGGKQRTGPSGPEGETRGPAPKSPPPRGAAHLPDPAPSPTHTARKHPSDFNFYLKSQHSIIYFVFLQPNR